MEEVNPKNIDRCQLIVPSQNPKEDAEAIEKSLHASTSKWPIPGTQQIGWKNGKVFVLLEIPWTRKTRWERVGLFRWRQIIFDDNQLDFAFEQLQQRWPKNLPLPQAQLL